MAHFRRSATAVAVTTAALIAGLMAGCTTPPSPSPSATATRAPTPTTTPTLPAPTVTPAPTPTSTPGSGENSAAKASAVEACQTWQESLSQDEATFPATQERALGSAQSAAAADSAYAPMVETMQELIGLIGDNSSEGLTRGQNAFTALSNHCSSVGVVVSAG